MSNADIRTIPAHTSLIELVFPQHTNHHGTLFGGQALSYMDKAAFIAGSRFSRRSMVTASSEKIDFHAPAYKGQIIELIAEPVASGRRSLTVEVSLIAENLLNGVRTICTRGRFVLVTCDKPEIEPGLPKIASDAASTDKEKWLQPSTETRMSEIIFPDKTNHYGTLFGGDAIAWMGKAAFVAATRYSRKVVVMAASERVDFKEPVQEGSLIEMVACVIDVGNSSMTVSVSMFCENLLTGERKLATKGSFIMVALDSNHKPCSVSLNNCHGV
ncbi:MAG: acyl-CoA thioesterase [Pseudomonadota bacterium]